MNEAWLWCVARTRQCGLNHLTERQSCSIHLHNDTINNNNEQHEKHDSNSTDWQ